MIEVRQYTSLSGRKAFHRWYEQLEEATRARVVVSINRLKQGSRTAKGVGGGVMELRLDFGPGYRIYFGRDGEQVVILLGGGTKKRQQTDIEEAQQLWHEYKQRKLEQQHL